MTNKKSTKRALLLSALSLLLCVSMLIGSTFAWFTDSVTSGNNIIKSGNLDVELEYKKVVDGVATEWATVKDKTDIFNPNALWEPGRVEVVYLKVSNLGTLALKYQLGVNVINETLGKTEDGKDIKLSDHLVFKTVETDTFTTYADREAVQLAAGTEKGLTDYNGKTTALEVGGEDYVALIVYMPETVGNEANYRGTDVPTINLGINLFATQNTVEKDSFDELYDKNAWHNAMKVSTANDLLAAIENAKNGDVIVFANDIESVDGAVITDKEITIDLNGNTFAVSEGASTNNRNFKIDGASVVTIQNGTLVAKGDTNSGAFGTIRTEGTANVTLSNLKLYNYRGNGLNVKAYEGTTVTINNTEIYSQYGGGVEAAGGIVELNNVKIEQKGLWTAPYNSMAVSVNGGGKATINGGTYTTTCLTAEEANSQGTSHGPWTIGVLNSGGTLVVNDGTFSNDNFGDNSLATNARGLILADTGAVVKINGGTFNALKTVVDIQNNLGDASKNPSVTLAGGIFSADPTVPNDYSLIKFADGFKAVENNGKYYVVAENIDSVVSTAAELAAAIANGGTISVVADIDMANSWTSVRPTREMTILGNGNTITNLNLPLLAGNVSTKVTIKGLTVADSTVAPAVVENGLGSAAFIPYVDAYGNVTFEDCHVKNSTINGNKRAAGLIAYTSGQSLTIKGCSVEGCNISAVGGAAGLVAYSQSVTTIENCSVKNSKLTATEDREGSSSLAGAVIGTVNANTTLTNVTVSGNTVSNNNATPVFNDCIGRWVAGELTIDGNTVLSNTTSAGLNDAIASGNTDVYLPAGEYKMPSSTTTTAEVNISGTKDTVLDVTLGAYMDSAENVTITGVTIKTSTGKANGNGSDYAALYAKDVTYVDCTFVGPMRVGRDGAKFVNCTFTQLGNDYVWTYGNDVTFEGCTFNTDGKAILIYSDGGNEISQVAVKNCIFNSTQGAKAGAIKNQNCAAIEIHNYGNGVNLTTEGNTYDSNFSGEWRIKTYESGKPKVFVNGTEYTTIALDGKTMTIDANSNVTVNP